MAATPGLKVFSPDGEYIASFHYAEDAAMFVGARGIGTTIRTSHSKASTVWTEGGESQLASESYDYVAATVNERKAERRAAYGGSL